MPGPFARLMGILWLLHAAQAAAAGAGERAESIEALEQRMAELVNRDRAEAGVPPLAYHKGLAAVARAHSADMKANRFFAHDSPRTGKVKDRVAAAAIPNRGVGENIARAATVESAQANLMLSQTHKENILRREFTHIGIGLARDDDGLLLCTQVFMKVPPTYDTAEITRQLVEGINKARLAKGLRRLLDDATLAQQATAHSERAARLGKFDPLWLEGELRRRDRRWRVHQAAYFLTEDLAEVIQSDVALSAVPDHVGVGVVQSAAKSKEAGALWVTLICAQKK